MDYWHLQIFYPITSDFSAWYAADFVLALIVSLTLAGQPLFRAPRCLMIKTLGRR